MLGNIETMYRLIRALKRRSLIVLPGACPRPGATLLPAVAMVILMGMACANAASTSPTPATTSKISVVTTTTVLADLARNVGGDLIQVSSVVPPGADVHSFQTTPSDGIAIDKAEVIISNGFGLDSFLDPVLANNKRPNAVRVVAAEGLTAPPLEGGPIPGAGEGNGHPETEPVEEVEALIHQAETGVISPEAALEQIGRILRRHLAVPASEANVVEEKTLEDGLLSLVQEAEEGKTPVQAALAEMEAMILEHENEENSHQHSGGDPHFWLDPVLAIHYVERIRDGLVQADPENAPTYSVNADEYIRELRDLDLEIAQALRQVPPEHRRLVSFHDAFGHFARRYGWEVSFFEPSDASSVTPGAVETIIRQIQSEGIPAIFAEPQFSPGVLEQAAKDTGVKVGILRSLCDTSAPTYVQLMRSNTESLVENLR